MRKFILVLIIGLIISGCQPAAPPVVEVPVLPAELNVTIPVWWSHQRITSQTEQLTLTPPEETATETDSMPVAIGVSLNRDYDWYIDQETTGEHAYDNCGPVSTVMAMTWYDQTTQLTPEQARAEIRPEGGWWYTDDIEATLTKNQVPNSYQPFESAEDIVRLIDSQRIAILCIDTAHLSYNPADNTRIGKFYDGSFGHFIVAKGYRYIDDELFIEVYDPWSLGQTYADGSLKGQDRLYPADELEEAIRQWWNWLIVVG